MCLRIGMVVNLSSNSVVAVIINMLSKKEKFRWLWLLNNLRKDGFEPDVYAYTSLITACVSNGKYREAVVVFKKMEEEWCRPTLLIM